MLQFKHWTIAITVCTLLSFGLTLPVCGSDQQQLVILQKAYLEQVKNRRFDDAEKTSREMIALAERAYRLGPFVLAVSLSYLADVHVRQERDAEALPLYPMVLIILKE
jgi:hypothetical protein